ncbi:hypothetical protein MKX08_006543 [Trichoderma sp. CBMAI-0020]|nr:hypothetical protein MKX08_006543 [Trichoderma sp. CBMAI-0020]
MSRYYKELPPTPLNHPQHEKAFYAQKLHPSCQAAEYQQTVLKHQNCRLQKQNTELQQEVTQLREQTSQLEDKIKKYQQSIRQQNESFVLVTRTVCSAFEKYRESTGALPAQSSNVSPIDQVINAYTAFSDSEEDLMFF